MTVMRASLVSLCCAAIFLGLFCSLAHATGRGTYSGALPVLVGIEAVQEDLKLTSLQEAVLDSIRNEYRSEAQQIYLGTQFNEIASRTHSQSALRRLQHKYNRRVFSTLNKAQKKQLRQIEIQILGGFLLLRDSIQQRLWINSSQKEQIAKIETKTLLALHKLNHLTVSKKITQLKRAASLHILRKNASEQLLKVLTPAQQQKLIAWAKNDLPHGLLAD